MGMICVLAEKPSVARDIARVLGANTPGKGCLKGGGYVVTWAVGHLVTQVNPEEIDARWKTWRQDTLPMLPENIPLKVIAQSRDQFQCVKTILNAPQVDSVICALDSLNYVTRPADVQKTFRRVHDALTPGGLFLFDINTPYKLEGLAGQTFLDETEDTYCVWRTEFDPKKRLCYYGMDLFQRDGEVWERSFEEHIEYAYTAEELTGWLREAGFTKIDVFGDRKCRAPKEDELRVYLAARKETT